MPSLDCFKQDTSKWYDGLVPDDDADDGNWIDDSLASVFVSVGVNFAY